jgi:hypothetical protein
MLLHQVVVAADVSGASGLRASLLSSCPKDHKHTSEHVDLFCSSLRRVSRQHYTVVHDSSQRHCSLGLANVGCCHCAPQVVPDGVLFFFPSYGAMDTLTARWQVCNLLVHCQVCLPRSSR